MKATGLICISLFLALSSAHAQDEGCNKCEMLREEYEGAVSPEKEKIYAYFKQECLQTDTVFVSGEGKTTTQKEASVIQVVAKSKCIDYKVVNEYEKTSKKEIRSFQVDKKDTVYNVAGTSPMFKGGDEALLHYFSNNIKYPAAAREKGVSGTVYIKCVVRKTGEITGVKAVRGPSADLKAEAERVVKQMPAWSPATFRSLPVSMYTVVPVRFVVK